MKYTLGIPKKILLLVGIGISGLMSDASASITFANTSGLGNAYSGEAAISDDASTLFYNPAGLSLLKTPQLAASFVGAFAFSRFEGSSTYVPGNYTQNGKAISKVYGQIPALFYTHPLSNKFTVGIGATPILGYAISNFGKNSIVRYAQDKSSIGIFDLTPGISYAVNDQLSVGLGLDFEYLIAEFLVQTQFLGAPGATPDQNSHTWARGFGCGWHGGLLYQFSPSTRIGLAYHSVVSFTPKGVNEFSIPGNPVDTVYRSDDYRSKFYNPPVTALSIYHDVNPNLAVMATIDYIEWGRLQSLPSENVALSPDLGSRTDINLKTFYSNAFEFQAGVNYRLTEIWMLRFGAGYSGRYSTSNIPDSLQGAPAFILAAGTKYQPSKSFGLDFGLMEFFLVNNANNNFNNGVVVQDGKHYFALSLLGAQLTWNLA